MEVAKSHLAQEFPQNYYYILIHLGEKIVEQPASEWMHKTTRINH